MPKGACGIRKPLLQHWREEPPVNCLQRAMDNISAITTRMILSRTQSGRRSEPQGRP